GQRAGILKGQSSRPDIRQNWTTNRQRDFVHLRKRQPSQGWCTTKVVDLKLCCGNDWLFEGSLVRSLVVTVKRLSVLLHSSAVKSRHVSASAALFISLGAGVLGSLGAHANLPPLGRITWRASPWKM